MNKRLKELAADAGYPDYMTYGQDMILERFAQLIVGECLTIAKTREDELESAGLLEESNAVGNVSYRISRQFGVKR